MTPVQVPAKEWLVKEVEDKRYILRGLIYTSTLYKNRIDQRLGISSVYKTTNKLYEHIKEVLQQSTYEALGEEQEVKDNNAFLVE